MLALRILCATVALLCVTATVSKAQERHALVVGINAYDNLGSLEKAVNDGRAMADSLERAGFTVDAGYDLDRRDFVLLLAQFLDRLEPDDEALVFYAGHAVAIENSNFLVPSDASALEQSSEALIIAESIGQDFLLDQITATGVRLTVVIMDACRNNPFEGLTTRSLGRDAGLAITQPPRGVFMMYSADEGQTALDRLSNDDPHPNSVFTRTLLPLIEEPGIDIVDIARRLRGDVQALAASVQHQQFPVYRDRMQGDGRFIVRPAAIVVDPAVGPAEDFPVIAAPTSPNPCAAARADWPLIGENPSAVLLEAFIAAHDGCPLMMTLASERLAALNLPPPEAPSAQVMQPEPDPEPTPAPQPAANPVLGPTDDPGLDVAALVQACVEVAHPDNVPWNDLQSPRDLFAAEIACDTASGALISGDSTLATHAVDYAMVTALRGRLLHIRDRYAMAADLYRRAAEAGNGVAAHNLGLLYEFGQGGDVDGAQAARWYRRAAELGRTMGWYQYAVLHYDGELVPRNYATALEGMQNGADAGDPRAMNSLGIMYREGAGVDVDIARAVTLFRRAAAAGNGNGMFNLGSAFRWSLGVAQNLEEAARWYQGAVDQGVSDAFAHLGLLYRFGDGVPLDYERAYELFLEGAEYGHGLAFLSLGQMNEAGEGRAVDMAEAVRWYRRGMDVGDLISTANLASAYYYGTGVPQDEDEAGRLFLRAAQAGHPRSMRNLGLFYRDGISFPQDDAEAMRWFRAALEAGDAEANNYIGWQFQFGNGVPVNNTEAAHWFMRGLAAGDPFAIQYPSTFNGAAGREMQALLRETGFYDGAIDGVIGPGTLAAMQAYLDAN